MFTQRKAIASTALAVIITLVAGCTSLDTFSMPIFQDGTPTRSVAPTLPSNASQPVAAPIETLSLTSLDITLVPRALRTAAPQSDGATYDGMLLDIPALPDLLKQQRDFVTDSATANDEAVNVTTSLVAASPKALGVQIKTMRGEPGSASESVAARTVWYDPSTRKPIAPRELFRDAASAESFWQIVQETVRESGLSASDEILNQPAATRSYSVAFRASSGDAVVYLDQPDTTNTGEAVVVQIPKTSVSKLLSPLGHNAQDATTQPTTVTFGPPLVDCKVKKCVALTFDDGPGASTPQILDILDKHGVPATFYVLGRMAKKNPDVIRRIHNSGHQIGNHSYNHPLMTQLSRKRIANEFAKTDAVVEDIIGVKPTTIRLPYGASSPRVNAEVNRPEIYWDVDTLDWKNRDPDTIVDSVKSKTAPGSIVLMHDIHPTTADSVEAIVKFLTKHGYTLVTVDVLLASQNPQPHTRYLRGS